MSATGGLQATVPLDLPAPRGRFSIPLAVQYNGTSQIGAPGAGWEVPLSYVRRSVTTWHRKPAIGTPQLLVPERIFLSLAGATFYMVPGTEPGLYVPFIAGSYMELRDEGTRWRLNTADGVEYLFEAWDPSFQDPGNLWLLSRITDRVGTDHAELEYAAPDCHGVAQQPDLVRIQYSFNAAGAALYEIKLLHEPVWQPRNVILGAFGASCDERVVDGIEEESRIIGHTVRDGSTQARSQILTKVIVRARNNLDAASDYRAIRTYQLGYAPDGDTHEPRLASVDMLGQEGPTQATIPIARYEYGQVSQSKYDDRVDYFPGIIVPWDPAATAAGATSLGHSEVQVEDVGVLDPRRREIVRSRHVLRDFTGDGVPDLVFKQGDTWHLRQGMATDAGPRFDTGFATTWTEPAEIFVQETRRYNDTNARWRRQAMVTTETIVQFVDWNGDGRLDIVDADAGSDLNHWKVWLNRQVNVDVLFWEPIQVDVSALLKHIEAKGLDLDYLDQGEQSRVAIERTRSWPKSRTGTCQRYWFDGYSEECVHDGDFKQADTQTEWMLMDVNSDSFPDLVARDEPLIECEDDAQRQVTDPAAPGSFDQMIDHYEWLSTPSECLETDFEWDGDHGRSVLYNRDGALVGAYFDGTFHPPVLSSDNSGVPNQSVVPRASNVSV